MADLAIGLFQLIVLRNLHIICANVKLSFHRLTPRKIFVPEEIKGKPISSGKMTVAYDISRSWPISTCKQMLWLVKVADVPCHLSTKILEWNDFLTSIDYDAYFEQWTRSSGVSMAHSNIHFKLSFQFYFNSFLLSVSMTNHFPRHSS